MGYESSYFGFGSPQQQVDMHARSKKHFHCLKICIYFFLFCSRLPNGSFNDSFFQTPPLRDSNLRWLVWWPSLLWLVFCVRMSITECPSPLNLAHSSVINTQTQCCQLSDFVARFSDFSDPPSDFFPKKRLATNLATSWTNLASLSLVLPHEHEILVSQCAHTPLSLSLSLSLSVQWAAERRSNFS